MLIVASAKPTDKSAAQTAMNAKTCEYREEVFDFFDRICVVCHAMVGDYYPNTRFKCR